MHRAKLTVKKFIVFCFCLFILNGWTQAQTTTALHVTTQPVAQTEFSAGSAECRQDAHNGNVCIYRQNAKFLDQDTKLWAPTIVVYRDQNNQTVKIQASADNLGNKAYYQGVVNQETTTQQTQQNAKKDTPINASANVITIYPPKNLMTLEGQAKVIRNHDIITGSYLEYDTDKRTILAKPKGQELTTIIFQPKNNDQSNKE